MKNILCIVAILLLAGCLTMPTKSTSPDTQSVVSTCAACPPMPLLKANPTSTDIDEHREQIIKMYVECSNRK